MPQNAIIKADGTEDYTSDIAWEAAEQSSDYGAVTNAFLDGDITRAARLTFAGTWPNGGKITALNNAFDGDLNNNPPTITSTAGANFTRNTSGKTLEFDGIAMVHGGTVGALDCRSNSASKIIATNCFLDAGTSKGLFQIANGASIEFNDSVGVNTGVQLNAGASGTNVTANNSSIFGDRNSTLLNNATANDTVIANAQSGTCFSGTTQSNNASTDATADTLDNIVVADNFVNSDPVGSGDYRISSGSDLDTNGIGAFIQSGGGVTVTGTAVPTQTEADVVSGGKTIILTLSGDTWVTSGATFDAQRQAIIDGLDSAQSELTGWNNEVRDKEVVTAVVRTSNTIVTITLTASAAYDITATETITATIPAEALVTSATPIVATPTFTVTAASGTILTPYYYTNLLVS